MGQCGLAAGRVRVHQLHSTVITIPAVSRNALTWRDRRFDGAESVVIVAAQKRTLGGRELQLPSMSSLTSKTSTQKFFLRVLQVIIQLREDTRRANKKAKQTGRLGESSAAGLSLLQ